MFEVDGRYSRMRNAYFCRTGILTIVSPSMIWPVDVVSVSSSGAAPVTLMDSVTAPDFELNVDAGLLAGSKNNPFTNIALESLRLDRETVRARDLDWARSTLLRRLFRRCRRISFRC